jgi:hypothetical protein
VMALGRHRGATVFDPFASLKVRRPRRTRHVHMLQDARHVALRRLFKTCSSRRRTGSSPRASRGAPPTMLLRRAPNSIRRGAAVSQRRPAQRSVSSSTPAHGAAHAKCARPETLWREVRPASTRYGRSAARHDPATLAHRKIESLANMACPRTVSVDLS